MRSHSFAQRYKLGAKEGSFGKVALLAARHNIASNVSGFIV